MTTESEAPQRSQTSSRDYAAAIEYRDFSLRIDLSARGGFVVQVTTSVDEFGEGSLELPDLGEEIAQLAAGFERARNWSESEGPGQAGELRDRLRSVGEGLFNALFPVPIRDLWNRNRGRLPIDLNQGLRIKIRLNLSAPEVARLHAIPWEYLYDGGFIGLNRRTPIVRHPELPLPGSYPPCPPPLRVLLVTAQPTDLAPLPMIEEERRALEELDRTREDVEVVSLATADLGALRDHLLKQEFHIIHFSGHGGFDDASGEGVLLFKGPAGHSVPVSGTILAGQLQDLPSLRLVFLNACETARAAFNAPFAGVANALLEAGIPMVLAMQFPVTDHAASLFATTVYRRIAAGDPIDAAVAEGRKAINLSSPHAMEWGTPALFQRSSGRLIEPRPAILPESPPEPPRSWPIVLLNLALFALSLVVVLAWIEIFTEWLPVVTGILGLGGILTGVALVSRVIPAPVKAWLRDAFQKRVLESRRTWIWALATIGVLALLASFFGSVALVSTDKKWEINVVPASSRHENDGFRKLEAYSESKWLLLADRSYLIFAKDLSKEDFTEPPGTRELFHRYLPPFSVTAPRFKVEELKIVPERFWRSDLALVFIEDNFIRMRARRLRISIDGSEPWTIDSYKGEPAWIGTDPPADPPLQKSLFFPYPLRQGDCIEVAIDTNDLRGLKLMAAAKRKFKPEPGTFWVEIVPDTINRAKKEPCP